VGGGETSTQSRTAWPAADLDSARPPGAGRGRAAAPGWLTGRLRSKNALTPPPIKSP
jgi:hypothetical protein